MVQVEKYKQGTCQKSSYWQGIRGLCIVMVVLIHCSANASGSGEEIYYMLVRNLINFPVAVFFFISGYFVNWEKYKEASGCEQTRKRLIRLLVPYFIYSLGYYVLRTILGERLGILQLCKHLLFGTIATPFYYILVLAFFTLITPFLISINKRRKALLCLVLVCSILLGGAYIIQLNGMNIWFYLKYSIIWLPFYYGGILVKRGDFRIPSSKSCKIYGWIFLAFFVQLIECLVLLRTEGGNSIAYSQIRFSGLLYAAVVVILFCSCRDSKQKWQWSQKFVELGDASYGIYFIHYAYLMLINGILQCFQIQLALPILRIGQCVLSLMLSMVTIKFLKCIGKNKSMLLFGV